MASYKDKLKPIEASQATPTSGYAAKLKPIGQPATEESSSGIFDSIKNVGKGAMKGFVGGGVSGAIMGASTALGKEVYKAPVVKVF